MKRPRLPGRRVEIWSAKTGGSAIGSCKEPVNLFLLPIIRATIPRPASGGSVPALMLPGSQFGRCGSVLVRLRLLFSCFLIILIKAKAWPGQLTGLLNEASCVNHSAGNNGDCVPCIYNLFWFRNCVTC
jgi:hypothetical protein